MKKFIGLFATIVILAIPSDMNVIGSTFDPLQENFGDCSSECVSLYRYCMNGMAIPLSQLCSDFDPESGQWVNCIERRVYCFYIYNQCLGNCGPCGSSPIPSITEDFQEGGGLFDVEQDFNR